MRARASAFVAAGLVAGIAQAAPLQEGAYQVEVRLELPNVINWAATRTTTICVSDAGGANDVPFAVLSRNNPLADCPARNLWRDGASLGFDILCEGRDAARGRALYTLLPDAFEGRIAMVMGGKNMTMTEFQTGRRIGDCDPPSASAR